MDYDFHYYATRGAARIAGWDEEEARTIATAALFVDYCDWSSFGYEFVLDSGQKLGYPVLTAQFNNEKEYLNHNDPSIWVPFHFLPGNYRSSGGTQYDATQHKTRITADGIKRTQYMCRPYSELVKKMNDDMAERYKAVEKVSKETALNFVGVRMHVLIDTWAHQDFSGFNQESINNCGARVTRVSHSDGDHGAMYDLDISAAGGDYDFKAAPPLLNSNMGHGRLGHLPDFGWLKMNYQPAWLPASNAGFGSGKQYHYRDNPKEFISAFLAMITELYRIRTGITKKVEVVDSRGKGSTQEKNLLDQNDQSTNICIPSSFIDIISKERTMAGKNDGAVPQAANAWCSKLKELGLIANDELRKYNGTSFVSEWEGQFAGNFTDDFTVRRNWQDQLDVLDVIPDVATLKPSGGAKTQGNFLSFQEATCLHLNFALKAIEAEPALKDGLDTLKKGWSVENSKSFRAYAADKFA